MERFDHVLRRVDDELRVPEPERSRILLEMAGDLEGLYAEFRRAGHTDREARRRAESWLMPDRASVDRLGRIHTPFVGRILASFSAVARSRVETGALTLLGLGSIAGGLRALWSAPQLWPPGPAVVVILAIGGAGLGLAGRHALDVLLPSEGGLRVPARLPGLLASSAAAALAAAVAALLHLRAAFLSGPPTRFPWEGVGAAAGTAALGLVVALALAIVWFWLAVRVRVVRRARADLREVVTFTNPKTQGG